LSFFDEGDEPRRSPRPRRPAGGSVTVDPATLRMRQTVLVAGALVFVILIGLGIRGCVNSATKRSLREYNRDVASLVEQSDSQVGRPFFDQLAGGRGAGDSLDLETQVNQLRVLSEDQVRDAKRLDVPEQMGPAQQGLLLVLEMRRDAMRKIAAKLPTAQGTGQSADEAVVQITGQMQLFYASDLVFKYRVRPYIEAALKEADVEGQTVADTNFFPYRPDQALNVANVASRLGATLSASRRGGPVAPGSHGHGLTSVSVAGQDLSPDTANRLPAGAGLTFTATFQNQGENDEAGVVVKVSIEGAGAPVTAQATVPRTGQGEDASVDIPLRQAPPIGTPVTIKVTVEPVPGEQKADNNTLSYPALFTRG
jgi:hypothetical protein